jgi:alpha-mannosidase
VKGAWEAILLPEMIERVPVAYTFGNHMHWVDMQWLWGYHVLPGSIRDMLHFCRETGAKGNVNFDGIGYEKVAAEAPEALAELRAAVQAGTIEVVGASYGQPYGLFHGGESNVRQRIYGVRAATRLLGVRPVTFWEEEFDFFPQLPQMLRGVGFEYASLFFQWTWHTPEVPKEDVPVVWWEGQDGSRLLTATRNRLNLHQWPEDIQILMNELAAEPPEGNRLILQWLELMPSKDWMCRSEVLLPKTKELLGDPRFDVSFVTLGEFLRGTGAGYAESQDSHSLPVRQYTMDDVWHGMSLGKNADAAPRRSHRLEAQILHAEALNAFLGLLGRPYANWDVYPTWELEEAWRNLLAAQHHDNHECEGLCGHVAETQYAAAEQLADHDRAHEHLAKRLNAPEGSIIVFNPFGWRRRMLGYGGGRIAIGEVPALGYRVFTQEEFVPLEEWEVDGHVATFLRGTFRVRVDLDARQIDLNGTSFPLPALRFARDQQTVESGELSHFFGADGNEIFATFEPGGDLGIWLEVPPHLDVLDIRVSFEPQQLFDKGMRAGPQTCWRFDHQWAQIIADSPYAVHPVKPTGPWPRKYPTGDWMTSPQWFETVEDQFTAQTLVDLVDDEGSGVLILHNGSQQWFAKGHEVRNLINMIDPWDEDRFEKDARTHYRLVPHGPMTHSERWRMGREMFGYPEWGVSGSARAEGSGDFTLPTELGAATCTAENVCITAFYRETADAGRGMGAYAGGLMEYPYVMRIVEFDGSGGPVTIEVAGTVERAVKTNLLGEPDRTLDIRGRQITLNMRPYEIATIYLDIVEGRKQARDLDSHRNIWATVHRVDE